MSIDFDFSEVHELARDLERLPADAAPKLRPVLQKGALNVKNQMRDEASGHPHFPAFPSSITFDTKVTRNGIEAEIGPDKDKPQGALGNLLYFGSSNNAAVLDINAALKAEEPKYVKAVGDVVEKLI